jgi:hypothetical protein
MSATEVNFNCEACNCEITRRVKEFERVSCRNCGAVYIAWRPPGHLEMKMRCVVRPVFTEPDEE